MQTVISLLRNKQTVFVRRPQAFQHPTTHTLVVSEHPSDSVDVVSHVGTTSCDTNAEFNQQSIIIGNHLSNKRIINTKNYSAHYKLKPILIIEKVILSEQKRQTLNEL
uniref:Uncharacterized protein n=1 Tax=Parascaris equorum TaxID=6256 RepID=A0A914S328_PAREQ